MRTKIKTKTAKKKPLLTEPVTTPANEYRALVTKTGSHLLVCDLLGIAPLTLKRRLDGRTTITREQFLALAHVGPHGNFVSPI